MVTLDAKTVDQTAAFAGLEAHQRGHGDAAAGSAVEPNHGRAACGCPGACAVRRHRDGSFVLEDQPCPERRSGGFARGTSPSWPPPPRPVRLPAGQAADTTRHAAAATPKLRGSTTTPPDGLCDQHAYARERPTELAQVKHGGRTPSAAVSLPLPPVLRARMRSLRRCRNRSFCNGMTRACLPRLPLRRFRQDWTPPGTSPTSA